MTNRGWKNPAIGTSGAAEIGGFLFDFSSSFFFPRRVQHLDHGVAEELQARGGHLEVQVLESHGLRRKKGEEGVGESVEWGGPEKNTGGGGVLKKNGV